MKIKKFLSPLILIIMLVLSFDKPVFAQESIKATALQPAEIVQAKNVNIVDGSHDKEIVSSELFEFEGVKYHYELLAIPFSALALLFSILYLKNVKQRNK